MSAQKGSASFDVTSSEGANTAEDSSAAEDYVASRLATGDSITQVLKSFNVENSWLECWLENNARHKVHASHTGSSSSGISSSSSSCSSSTSMSGSIAGASKGEPQVSNHENAWAVCAQLPVAAIAALVTEWVTDQRALAEAEELCCCALRGDLAGVLDLLAGDSGDDSNCSNSISSGSGGVPWDAEDRLGVTAGEYALCGGTPAHAQCFAALVNAGANDLARRMDAALDAADSAGNKPETSSTAGLQSFSGDFGPKQPFTTNGRSEGAAVSASERRSWDYLAGPASYGEKGCLLDAQRMPVMMPWEGALMEAHARFFVGTRVLNVGFGCGLVDRYIQRWVTPLAHHTIIEPHPDVLKEARKFADAVNHSPHESSRSDRLQKKLPPLAETTGSAGDIVTSRAVENTSLACEVSDAETNSNPSQDCHCVVEVLENTWQSALPSLAAGSLDTFFYDTHDEGVPEFLQVARLAAQLLNGASSSSASSEVATMAADSGESYRNKKVGGNHSATTEVAEKEEHMHSNAPDVATSTAATGVGTNNNGPTSGHSGLFSYWNGMEFHNAFRHAAYCEATRRHMCGSNITPPKMATPRNGNINRSRNFARVDFVRVPVNLGDEDWRCWAAKGLAYWHLQAYYLPLCWTKSCEGGKGRLCPDDLKIMDGVEGFAVVPPPPPLMAGLNDGGEGSDSREGQDPATGCAPEMNNNSSAAAWCCARREDLAPWMVEGIRKGAERFGLAHCLVWDSEPNSNAPIKRPVELIPEDFSEGESLQKRAHTPLEVK